MRIVFIFSGQGAQSPGMGKDLYNSCGEAKKVFDEADSVLDWPVSELCFEGPAGKLTESRFCQPSIYTVSMACLAAFQEKYPNVKPEGCAGLSLGEFAALGAAGVFSFADGLKLVARRGVLMDNACHDTDGGMASVLGGDPEIISRICSECDVDVANYNCPGQIVISGEKSKVKQAIVALKEKGMRKIIPLKVAGAYHSRLMAKAGSKFREVLADVPLNIPELPVAQNYTGKTESETEKISSNLVNQVAGSVRWEDCVRGFIEKGADTFIEFGPGNVLTGLIKRIDRNMKLCNINSVENLEKFAENL